MGTDEHTYKGTFGETPEQFTARMHIVRGEVKLTHAGEKAQLEAQLAAMTEQRDAWEALAKAERVAAEANRFGATYAREDAYAAVLVARDTLRALGIDRFA